MTLTVFFGHIIKIVYNYDCAHGDRCFLSVCCSRSTSRDRKRSRWEEERDRRSESSSGPNRERSYSSVRSRDSEETFADRDRDREREREREREPEREKEKGDDEKEEEELLKPAWIRCTHAENYYSNDPMDQVVLLLLSLSFLCSVASFSNGYYTFGNN